MNNGSRLSVLLVDDEQEFCEILGEQLKSAGFDVLFVNTGHRALNLIENCAFDVVITDISMPDGDGISLVESIGKRQTSSPLLIFVTGYSALELEDAATIGAAAVFNKPVSMGRLIDFIRLNCQPGRVSNGDGREKDTIQANPIMDTGPSTKRPSINEMKPLISQLQAINEMAGVVIHDVNNSLAIIHGRAGQLKRFAENGTIDIHTLIKAAENIQFHAMRATEAIQLFNPTWKDKDTTEIMPREEEPHRLSRSKT